MRVAAPGPRAVWRPPDPAVSLPSDSCEDSSSFVCVVGWVSLGLPTLRVLPTKTQRLSPSRTAGATGCKSAVIVIEQLSGSAPARCLDGLQQLAAHASTRRSSTPKLQSDTSESDVGSVRETPTPPRHVVAMLRASRLLRVELRLGAARRRLSLAYSPPLTGADYLHTPKFWTGLEPEKAPGFDAERNCLASLKAPDLRERGPKLRDTLEDYFENGWALTEVLFSSLRGPEAYYRPPAHGLRHPLVFYYGHPAVRSRRPVV